MTQRRNVTSFGLHSYIADIGPESICTRRVKEVEVVNIAEAYFVPSLSSESALWQSTLVSSIISGC